MSELTNDHMKEPVYSAKCNLFGKTLSHEIQAIFVKRYALKRSRNIGTVNIARKLRQNGTNQSHRGRVVREVTDMVLQTSAKGSGCLVCGNGELILQMLYSLSKIGSTVALIFCNL